jgi:hypothetical protein
MATTGASLVLLAMIAMSYQGSAIFLGSIFQTLAVNFCIHAGLLLMRRFESQYYLVEVGLELGYILVLVVLFGTVFDWYSSAPLWVWIMLGCAVYVIGGLIGVFRIKNDVDIINQLIQKNNKE